MTLLFFSNIGKNSASLRNRVYAFPVHKSIVNAVDAVNADTVNADKHKILNKTGKIS